MRLTEGSRELVDSRDMEKHAERNGQLYVTRMMLMDDKE